MEPYKVDCDDIVLAPIKSEDAEQIYRLCQDKTISENTTLPADYSREDAVAFVSKIAPSYWADGGAGWGIYSLEDGVLAGVISLMPRSDNETELGYWLGADFRGRGWALQAARAAVTQAFEKLGLDRIIWQATSGNWPSWRIAWRLGFRREGEKRQPRANADGTYAVHRVWQAGLLRGDRLEPVMPWDGPGKQGDIAKDATRPEDLVRQFHRVYGLPIVTDRASVDRERVHMRMSLIYEEVSELTGAVYGAQARQALEAAIAKLPDEHTRDVIEAADALADLTYVVYGMALECGISMPAVLREVQASNLSKLDRNGRPIYRKDGKVLKGEDFFNPNIARALETRLED